MAIVAARGRLAVSARDRRIVLLALRKLRGARVDFGEALRALREAVEESIPGGRIFRLGAAGTGPIVGSIISGVGIVDGAAGVQLVRVVPGGSCLPLGAFSPTASGSLSP